jgi:phage terminase small subunit
MNANPESHRLTPKQGRFCQEYAIDQNATAAAKRAGFAGKAAHVTASRLLRNPKVASRIGELQAAAAKRAEVSIDDVIGMLLDDRRSARAAGQYGPAVRAVELLGRRLGAFTDRVEISEAQALSDDELVRRLSGDDERRAKLVRELLGATRFPH